MMLSEGVDACGTVEGQFVCELIGRFSEMLGSLIEKCMEASLVRVEQQEKATEELLELVQ